MPISVRPVRTLVDRLRERIHALLALARRTLFLRSATESALHLVVRTFTYKNGRTCAVKLQSYPMAALLRAMKRCPSIEVTQPYTSACSGSFRTHAQQKSLYDAYKAGTGHLASPPYTSWHEAAVALDILNPDTKDPDTRVTPRQALEAEGFHSDLPADPPHLSYGVDTKTNRVYGDKP